jgi:hypothetical protein
MRFLVLPVAMLALAASLAACDTTNGSSRSGGGLFGSSTPPAAVAAPGSRAIERACNPGNVPANQRASVLHQDRPGGSDCPDAVTTPRR